MLHDGDWFVASPCSRRRLEEVKSRRPWLAPATLTDEEAARCARGPQQPAEWLQARINGSICVRYGQREFKNRFSTTDGRVIRQFVVDRTTNGVAPSATGSRRTSLICGAARVGARYFRPQSSLWSGQKGILLVRNRTAHGARPQRRPRHRPRSLPRPSAAAGRRARTAGREETAHGATARRRRRRGVVTAA